ncbi:MAG TPA: hypothetical protein VMC03_00865 [Streptosporangiaceae bacterium]|nr:hypothetical protein [Streptosporangiaceae bacterium]
MRRTAAAFAVTASALLLAACGSSGNSSSASSAQTSAPSSAAPAATTQNAAAPSQSAAATSLDPCQLVTSSEASSLAGTTYGSGQEETDNGGKRCVYGSGTTNVFTVEVAQAQDSATAQADWAQDQSEAQAAVEQKLPSGVNVTLDTQNVTGLADRAATATGSTSIDGQAVGFSGIYLLKGATFLAFQDVQLGSAAPTASAMQTEAATALARVP